MRVKQFVKMLSPSDLKRIPSNNQELIPLTPETFRQNEVHPQQLQYGGNASLPNLKQAKTDSTQADTNLMPANIDDPAANTNSLKAAELEQCCRKYGSLLERHQALLKQAKSQEKMTGRAIKQVCNQ
jgi:hypothetical protein